MSVHDAEPGDIYADENGKNRPTPPEFTLTRTTRKRDRRGVICLGEQIATVEWDTNMRQGWRVRYAHRPPNARLALVSLADAPREPATFSDAALIDGIREMLADGRLPYGEALAQIRIAISEDAHRRAAQAAAAERRERQEAAGPALYEALKAIVRAVPMSADLLVAAKAALARAEHGGE